MNELMNKQVKKRIKERIISGREREKARTNELK